MQYIREGNTFYAGECRRACGNTCSFPQCSADIEEMPSKGAADRHQKHLELNGHMVRRESLCEAG